MKTLKTKALSQILCQKINFCHKILFLYLITKQNVPKTASKI